MHETHRRIFGPRGYGYHAAMADYPEARRREFELLVQQADIRDGQIVCDAPAGGGFVRDYIQAKDVTVIAVETCRVHYDRCVERPGLHSLLSPLETLPLPTGTLDAALSLASLHDLNDREAAIHELGRVLREGGRLCLADIAVDSPVAAFLENFVREYSSHGHEGQYLDDETRRFLADAGLDIVYDRRVRYPWMFTSVVDMVRFCRLLFRLDRADPDTVLEGLYTHLGCETEEDLCALNWELDFITAVKRAA
jgi:SAM-dependent methyltransferase